MIWVFVVGIILFMLVKFSSALNKDNEDMQGGTAADKFSIIAAFLNDEVFTGKGVITTIDKRSFNLYDGYNQIIQFHYSTGHLTIKWKYKYYQKEVIHERTFNNVRNLSIFEQQKIATQMLEEMRVVVSQHKIDVLNF